MKTITTGGAQGDGGNQQYIPVGSLVYPLHSRENIDRRFRDLGSTDWIRVEPLISHDDSTVGITRVYLLPNDSENGRVSRSNPSLLRKQKELLSCLDFSPASWNGASNQDARSHFPSLSPRAQAIIADDEKEGDMSLLKMFNTIPSPNPDVKSIQEDLSREFMSNLLAGTVGGVVTEMYPYQCRSAALMHQKEVQPGQVLDPRLIEVLDQEGSTYFYNPVTGDVFREPRYYDGVRGGILAEEMGAGKTLICLALITATKNQPASAPELTLEDNITHRPRIGSLMDMAAAVATKHACPWKSYIDPCYTNCIKAIEDNPGWYYLPRPESRRASRGPRRNLSPYKIYLSHATLVVVPANLLDQWKKEISKHTQGLEVHVVSTNSGYQIPEPADITKYDIVLCTVPSLEKLWQDHRQPEQDGSWTLDCSLGRVRWKRMLVDEGHKLGNVRLNGAKTGLLQALDSLQANARWIVTGTPSQGLFGMEEGSENNTMSSDNSQERKDLERIGAIAKLYLKARPWSNTSLEYGDTPAEWKIYMLQPKHSSQGRGRRDCLRSIFNSLIIRHRLSEVSQILPPVDAKIVRLEGSFQDKLALNLFSMMITFNAVQSQRTDQDYFFHQRNRKYLLELVSNLRQASFFGGALFSVEDIAKSVSTAEEFLEQKSVTMNEADTELLNSAIAFGKMAADNSIKGVASVFHEMPIYIQHFPGGAASQNALWSMDQKSDEGLICTNWKLMMAAQKLLRPMLGSVEELNTYLNSDSFATAGHTERAQEILHAQPIEKPKARSSTTLAGNTKLGKDHVSPRKRHSAPIKTADEPVIPTPPQTPEESIEIAAPLADTQLVSTTSAKLSYLIDAIVAHQKDEQILVFYENDNVAWYLAGMLDMLQIHHLIYAKGITAQRRAAYVATFNQSPKFRVMLMDISQAAFGLDMRSASRIYFVNPVLNPNVEAQAVGRARRISQQRRVTVETLVLMNSLEEVIVERKERMTQAEHRQCKTILDDRPIYEWILNPRFIPLTEADVHDGPRQMVKLERPQYIFGREFGHEQGHPDEDILMEDPSSAADGKHPAVNSDHAPHFHRRKFGRRGVGTKRARADSPATSDRAAIEDSGRERLVKRARFADEEAGEASSSAPVPVEVEVEGFAPVTRPKVRFADED